MSIQWKLSVAAWVISRPIHICVNGATDVTSAFSPASPMTAR
ncbi:MAG TPA: hypothetical protein VGL86_30930 [Polyangia bacterium]